MSERYYVEEGFLRDRQRGGVGIAFVYTAPDAHRIATALNAHEPLVEACEVAIKASWHSESFRMESWRSVVRAAIAKATPTNTSAQVSPGADANPTTSDVEAR